MSNMNEKVTETKNQKIIKSLVDAYAGGYLKYLRIKDDKINASDRTRSAVEKGFKNAAIAAESATCPYSPFVYWPALGFCGRISDIASGLSAKFEITNPNTGHLEKSDFFKNCVYTGLVKLLTDTLGTTFLLFDGDDLTTKTVLVNNRLSDPANVDSLIDSIDILLYSIGDHVSEKVRAAHNNETDFVSKFNTDANFSRDAGNFEPYVSDFDTNRIVNSFIGYFGLEEVSAYDWINVSKQSFVQPKTTEYVLTLDNLIKFSLDVSAIKNVHFSGIPDAYVYCPQNDEEKDTRTKYTFVDTQNYYHINRLIDVFDVKFSPHVKSTVTSKDGKVTRTRDRGPIIDFLFKKFEDYYKEQIRVTKNNNYETNFEALAAGAKYLDFTQYDTVKKTGITLKSATNWKKIFPSHNLEIHRRLFEDMLENKSSRTARNVSYLLMSTFGLPERRSY